MKSASEILRALATFHVPAEEHTRDNLRAEMGIMAAFAPAEIPTWFDQLLKLSEPGTAAAGPTSPFPAGHHMLPAVRLVEQGWSTDDAVMMALDNQEIQQPTEEDLLNLLGYSMALKVHKGDNSDEDAMRQMDREMRWKAFYGTTLAMYVQQEFDRFPIQEKWMPDSAHPKHDIGGLADWYPDSWFNAKAAYERYGQSAGWVNFAGDPMPTWEQLPERIQQHWCAVMEPTRMHAQDLEPSAVVTTEGGEGHE